MITEKELREQLESFFCCANKELIGESIIVTLRNADYGGCDIYWGNIPDELLKSNRVFKE